MATLLIATRGLPSLVYPAIELARRLAAAGHHVTFGGDPESEMLARPHQLTFLALEPDHYDTFLEEDAHRSRPARIHDWRRRRDQARQSLGADQFAADIRSVRPDLVLVNGEMHPHVISAAATGVPVVLLNSFVSIWRRPGLPPPHHLGRPGAGWRGSRAGAALLWENLRLRKWRRRWLDFLRQTGCDRRSAYQALAERVGFDLAGEIDDRQWLIPFTYRRLPVLSLHALEFEFRHHPPPHVHYVGPMILESRPGRPLDVADRTRLDRLLLRRRAGTETRTLIYAGFGSVLSADRSLIRRLLDSVAERPSWDLILSTSGRLTPDDLGSLPDRVHVFPWVPQPEVLAVADAAITHGGINTVDECVTAGVPMLIYCGGETDMAGTTSRVVHHGIGIQGHRRDSAVTIRAHLDRLLGDPGFRERVGRLQRRYAAYAEDRVAERTVEALLGRAVADGNAPDGASPGGGVEGR